MNTKCPECDKDIEVTKVECCKTTQQPGISAKEKRDYYLEFSRSARQRFDTRRTYEWKLNLALWAAIAIFAVKPLNSVLGDTKAIIKLTTFQSWVFLGIHAGILLVYTFLWSSQLHKRNQRDRLLAMKYHKAVEKFVRGEGLPEVDDPSYSCWKALCNWAALTQILVTAGLLALDILFHWKHLTWA